MGTRKKTKVAGTLLDGRRHKDADLHAPYIPTPAEIAEGCLAI